MQISSKELILHFLGEINKMRTHPHAFLKHFEDRLKSFDEEKKEVYTRLDLPNIQCRTVEGAEAVKVAHDFLLSRQPIEPLQLSFQLCEAAFVVGGRISRDRQPSNIQSYEKGLIQELTSHRCKAHELYAMLQYGFRKDRELVPSIIIDDGNPLRNRREAIFSQNYKFIGLAVHQHQEFDYQLLILLAEDIQQLDLVAPSSNCQCILM